MATQDDERYASRKIADLLKAEIEAGVVYPPGAQLPSIRRLASVHGVAQNTAQRALQLLQNEGLVEIRPQSGAYVREPPAATDGERSPREELTALQAKLGQAAEELGDARKVVADLLGRLPEEDPAD